MQIDDILVQHPDAPRRHSLPQLSRRGAAVDTIERVFAVFEQIKLAGLNGKEITTLGCWLGMLSFLAQYYFLFTGLSDMAKGLGLTNGFVYPDNYTNIEADGLFTGMIKSFSNRQMQRMTLKKSKLQQ